MCVEYARASIEIQLRHMWVLPSCAACLIGVLLTDVLTSPESPAADRTAVTDVGRTAVTGMRLITTFRSTTHRIYDGGPISL